MSHRHSPHVAPSPRPSWCRWLIALLVACALALPATADAQRKKKRKRKKRGADKSAEVSTEGKGKGRTKVFDFTGLELGGRLRTPQLLYFLDRAEQELDRAALEKRSFIPEMARSMQEEEL